MGTAHPSFAAILDHLAGHEPRGVAAHLARCGPCAPRAAEAARLLAAGRRAHDAPRPGARLLRRAVGIFRAHRRGESPGLLRLVLDSWLQPAPALRTGTARARFLRFEGEVVVEMQLTVEAGRVEVRGQLTPPDFAAEVVAIARARRKRAKVGGDGTFLLRGLPRTRLDFEIGTTRIRDVKP